MRTDPDCARCDFTKGQIWLEDRNNCHMYHICEPLVDGDYRIHHATCGEHFWDQAFHTCVPILPSGAHCLDGPVALYLQASTTKGKICVDISFSSHDTKFLKLTCDPVVTFVIKPPLDHTERILICYFGEIGMVYSMLKYIWIVQFVALLRNNI